MSHLHSHCCHTWSFDGLLRNAVVQESCSIPISILKPLKGIDDDLEHNLTSFCKQTHPQYEIIFGAADASDPALPIARRVARLIPKYPFGS